MSDEEKAALIRRIVLKLHSKPHEVSRGRELWSEQVINDVLEELL